MMIAPIIDPPKPLKKFMPKNSERYLPKNDPPMPMSMVTMMPPGSLPGINSFPIAPATRPMSAVQMIDNIVFSFGVL